MIPQWFARNFPKGMCLAPTKRNHQLYLFHLFLLLSYLSCPISFITLIVNLNAYDLISYTLLSLTKSYYFSILIIKLNFFKFIIFLLFYIICHKFSYITQIYLAIVV